MNHDPFYRKLLIPLNLQTFAGEGGDGGDGGQDGGNDGGAGDDGNQDAPPDIDPKVKAYYDKLLQSENDKVRTKYTKEKSELERRLNQLEKKYMTEEQRKQHEDAEKERVLAERERDLNRKSLELIATTELATAQLPVAFKDIVVGVDESSTKQNIKTVQKLIEDRVNEEVTNRLRSGGRIPAGAGQKGAGRAGDANNLMNSFIRQHAGRQ